ncbi:MAG: DUF333 domain-containing protein [Pseudobdellovibrionaceae bacterium]
MKSKITYLILGALVITAEAHGGGSSTVGPANPAAVNCIKLGGTLERVVTPAGEDANCVIDEWKLYKEMSDRGLVKRHNYENISIPNPASVNCLDIKGTLRIEETPEGQRGLCVVGQWDLFRAIDITREN